MYDPARTINRFAASNKLAEAFALGRPVIVNSEMVIVEQFSSEPCLVCTAYGAVGELAQAIGRLVDEPALYLEACVSARELYEREYSWERARSAAQEVLGKPLTGRDQARC